MSKLDELISRYGNLKSEMDSYKKQIDSDNKSIKDIMSTEGITEHTAGGYTAKYTIAVQESFDDNKLVEKLKDIWFKKHSYQPDISGLDNSCPWIKTVIIPNMEAIENSIYSGELNASELANCKVVKNIPKLTIKKVKEKKNEN